MARAIENNGDSIVVQGFKPVEGYPEYVYFGIYTENDEALIHEWSMTPEDAHTLSEYIRQEAESATAQGEGSKDDV